MSFGAERLKNKDGNVFYPVTHASCSFVNWKGETDFSAYTDSDGNSKTYKDKYVDIVTDLGSEWVPEAKFTYLGYVRWILDPDNAPEKLYAITKYIQSVNLLPDLLNKTNGFPDYVALSQVSIKNLDDDAPRLDLSDFNNDVELTEIQIIDTGEAYFTAALKDTKTADYSGANFAYGRDTLVDDICELFIPEGILKPDEVRTQALEYTLSQVGDTRNCKSQLDAIKVTLLAPVHPNLFEGVDVSTLTEENYVKTLADKCRENLRAGIITNNNITVDSTDDDILNEYHNNYEQLANDIMKSKYMELIAPCKAYVDEFNNKHPQDFMGAHNCEFSSSSDGTATLSFYNGNKNDNKVVATLELTKITT
nr:MAG TPA: hypothetical protein [Herelleviridae sp.]